MAKKPTINIAARKGGNGGYSQKSEVANVNLANRKLKQNIGRSGSVKTPKS
jgi:hypothetical protein